MPEHHLGLSPTTLSMPQPRRIKRFLFRWWLPLWTLIAFAFALIAHSGMLGQFDYDDGGVGTFLFFCAAPIIALPLYPALILLQSIDCSSEISIGLSLVITLPLTILIQLGLNALLDLDRPPTPDA